MNYTLLISLLFAAVSGIFSLTRQYQMLQQNSYFPSRYCPWIRDSFAVQLAVVSILFCASSLLYSAELYIIQALLLFVLMLVRIVLAVKIQKKSIKKLVFTSRIKRLFFAATVIQAVLIAVYCIIPQLFAAEICVVILFMLSLVTPLFALLCWTLTYPAERAVSRWYINDAKRILREHKNLKVIGVTGSYGKTTTKFILSRILSEKYNVVATPQSYNTPMGVVRTVRGELRPQTEIFICEMGAKNIGDIKEICDIAHPDFGIITSVGQQHLDTFKSVDNVFKTKFELADEVRKNGGTVFVNGDSKEIISRINKSNYKIYGENTEFFAENISYGKNGSIFDLVLCGEKISVTTKLLGLHSVNDIIGAAAVAYTLGVTPNDIKYAVGTLKPTEHRLELKNGPKGSMLIDDAYNANPEGCLEAVRVLGSFKDMLKVIITPGLIELGEKEYECNYALGLEAAKYCDIIILVGKNRSKPMREAVESTDFDGEKLYIVSSFKEAMGVYLKFASENSVVLLENDLPDNYLN